MVFESTDPVWGRLRQSKVNIDYEGIDPFDICMSALALGLVSDLELEHLWIACNEAQSAEEFDVAIQASCDLKDLVTSYYSGGKK